MTTSSSRLSRILLANLMVFLLFIAIVTPNIIWNKNSTFHTVDQNLFHLRQVKTFVNQPLSWGRYPSSTATTPGHHLVLSWVSQHFANGEVEPNTFPIRIANALFGLGLILSLWWLVYLGETTSVLESTYLVLPFLFSYQFLGSSIWVMTDNGALLWSCLTLLLLLIPISQHREKFTLSLAGIFAALAVVWRQTSIWLLAPIFLGLAKANQDNKHWKLYLPTLLPSLLVIGYFLFIWQGLTPPEFSGHARGLNFTALIYIISLFGVFGLFYLGYLSTELKKISNREILWIIVISVIVGLSLAILFPSSYARDAGRYGGWLWKIAKQLPSIYDRSVLFLLLCPLGTVLISLWYKVIARNKNSNDFLILASTSAWILPCMGNYSTFQRYYEPLILIFLTFLVSRQANKYNRSYIGALILAGLLATISLPKIIFG